MRVTKNTIFWFSIITTGVALLQIGYWAGWLSFQLPQILVTFKEGANTEQGREIFALFIGDTEAHTWSGALAMQALLIWLMAKWRKYDSIKIALFGYFLLLTYILIRISVRNSILGLLVAIIGIEVIKNIKKRGRDFVNPLIKVIFVIVFAIGFLYLFVLFAPDYYFIQRVKAVIPSFDNGVLVISRTSNIFGRLDYWQTAFEIFQNHPLVGGGFYSFRELSAIYRENSIVHAHSSYFQTMAELGLLGVFALVILIVATAYYLWKSWDLVSLNDRYLFWWEYVTGSFIFLAFAGYFGNPFWSPNYIGFRMVSLGILAALVFEKKT